MQKVYELAGIKHSPVVAHHRSTNSLVERYVQTLGKVLKAMEHLGSWDEVLFFLVFAIRDAPTASLGWHSPNDLTFGSRVAGSLQLLKANWEGNKCRFVP